MCFSIAFCDCVAIPTKKKGTGFMNTVIENIITRRSVRRFTEERIPDDALALLGEAAINAPSGMNRQEWQFIFIKNKEKIATLASLVGKALNRENYDLYKPACYMIACAKPFGNLSAADCACALENVFLAATSLNIGSVWINQIIDAQDAEKVREYLLSLGMNKDYRVYGSVSLGYSAEDGEKRARKENCVKFVD